MSNRIHGVKIRHHAHQIQRRLEAVGKKVSIGHIYEALAAQCDAFTYKEWRQDGRPLHTRGAEPSKLALFRMQCLKHTENDSKLIVQTVHDVLEEQEPRHVR